MSYYADDYDSNGVSILTCTNRPNCMNTLFTNYDRQNYKKKELIVILNNNNMKLYEYITKARQYRNVRIYNVPDYVSLGNCLNYGVRLSSYNHIAKFDDDDYYAPNYLTDSMQIMQQTNADIVGKRAHYMYLSGKKLLLFRFYNTEKKYVSLVQGATLLVKRHVFNQVSFPDQSRNECVKFCLDSAAKGFKIYSGNRYNFIAIRKSNPKDHTWMVSDKYLLTKNVRVLKVKHIRRFVRQD